MISPWTRDARIRVETIAIAPEVSGVVKSLRVADNQPVSKGDVLFVIDPRAYEIAVAQASAVLDGQQHSTQLAQLKSQRRANLTELSISKEEKEQYDVSARVADAAVDQARAQLDMAKLNLERTIVRSPVKWLCRQPASAGGRFRHGGPGDVSPSWIATASGSRAISRKPSSPPSIPATRPGSC